MTEAAVSFAGNLTDQPELRRTEGGIVSAVEVVAEELGPSLRWATAMPVRSTRTASDSTE
jgi:single-stranded DNA-binding protein